MFRCASLFTWRPAGCASLGAHLVSRTSVPVIWWPLRRHTQTFPSQHLILGIWGTTSHFERSSNGTYIRGKQTITVKLVSDIVYNLLFKTQFCRRHIKGNGPFLWRVLSGGEGAGEWPSIIHLKRDCCPPLSLSPAGPPTMGPNSRLERFTPGPNPSRMGQKRAHYKKTHHQVPTWIDTSGWSLYIAKGGWYDSLWTQIYQISVQCLQCFFTLF